MPNMTRWLNSKLTIFLLALLLAACSPGAAPTATATSEPPTRNQQ